MHHSLTIHTLFGPMTLVASPEGLKRLYLPGVALPADLPPVSTECCHLVTAANQLIEYSKGKRTRFDLPLILAGTPFQIRAWQAMARIPYGTTASYRDIASLLGGHRKARAVGMAARANPLPIIIPCHRIIGANGTLTGFSAGIDLKSRLLAHEGIQLVPQGEKRH